MMIVCLFMTVMVIGTFTKITCHGLIHKSSAQTPSDSRILSYRNLDRTTIFFYGSNDREFFYKICDHERSMISWQ